MVMLKAGDFFCVRGENFLSKAIIAVEKVQAKDDQARYSHTGIIVDDFGKTVEALETITYGELGHYIGNEILIGRWVGMTPTAFNLGMAGIAENINRKYPWWKILFHFLGVGKIRTGVDAVCSELFCRFIIAAGCTEIGCWSGQNPDDIADYIHRWDVFEVIYEGEWKGLTS